MISKDNIKYIKQVKSLIPFNSKDKKEFIKLLERQISEYTLNHPNCTFDNIVDEFGTPSETAGEYIQQLDTTDIIKYLNKRSLIKIFMTIFIVAIVIISLFKVYRLNQLYEEAKENSYSHFETIIEEE